MSFIHKVLHGVLCAAWGLVCCMGFRGLEMKLPCVRSDYITLRQTTGQSKLYQHQGS